MGGIGDNIPAGYTDEGEIDSTPRSSMVMWRSEDEIRVLMDTWFQEYLERPTSPTRLATLEKFLTIGMISTIWNPINNAAWNMAYKLCELPKPEDK